MIVPPGAIAAQILQDGGSATQAVVGAALASGVESDGDPTELSGGIGPAAGLFQFEPGTWRGAGGGAYAPVAQEATWQQQVQVFVNDTKGNNFGAWGPDLVANSGDPNNPNNSAYGYSGAPQPGSKVYNQIQKLAASGALNGALNDPQGVLASIASLPGEAAGAGGQVASDLAGLSGLSGLEQGVDTVLTDITSAAWWKRIGIFTGGLALIVAGIAIFISTTKTGQTVESDAAVAAAAA
jgi:Transglycosylase-like domain